MNLEDLRERRRRERQQDSLQSLSETFYGDVADYLQELKAAREAAAEQAADPYGDPEVRRLTDELQTAESVVESLYERRVGKVVKHASFAAADMPHEREGLTEEERALFDDLVARIKQNRGRVLDTLAGEGETGDADGSATPTSAAHESTDPTDAGAPSPDAAPEETAVADRDDPAGMLADAMGVGDDEGAVGDDAMGVGPDEGAVAGDDPPTGETSPDEAPPTPPHAPDQDGVAGGTRPPADSDERRDVPDEGDHDPGADVGDDPARDERTTVKITADVGEIYGVDDRDYHLEAEDVVDLPADNAAPLIEKEAAERL